MLAPKRAKYRKQFRNRMKGLATRGNTLSFGAVGLKSLEAGWVTATNNTNDTIKNLNMNTIYKRKNT